MNDTALLLWCIPMQFLKWLGLLAGLAAVLLLAELLREHWSVGRDTDRELREDDQ